MVSIIESDESQCCDNPNCRTQNPILTTARTNIKTAKNAVAAAEKKLAEAMNSGFDQMKIGLLQKDVDYQRELILGLQQNNQAAGPDQTDLPEMDQIYCGNCIGPASPPAVAMAQLENAKEPTTISNGTVPSTRTLITHMSWTNGITLTLTAVTEPVTRVLLQTSHVLARSALSSGDFAGAAEISRFHLKLIETCKVTENNNATNNPANNRGNGVNRSKHPLNITQHEEAHVWVTRAVAFAGMNSFIP